MALAIYVPSFISVRKSLYRSISGALAVHVLGNLRLHVVIPVSGSVTSVSGIHSHCDRNINWLDFTSKDSPVE